jgi:alpha-D-xyloside xylohydrolase
VVGFGESFGRLDKVGSSQTLWLQEAFGNASPASYKQVPVLSVQPRARRLRAHLERRAVRRRLQGALGAVRHGRGHSALDWFVLAGAPAQVLAGYTGLTGAPAVPPPWSFGFWLGRITYNSQERWSGSPPRCASAGSPAT